MTTTIKVLDHGFVTLRNLAGPTRRTWTTRGGEVTTFDFDADDTDPANSARMSFEGQDQSRSYDVEMKLTRYLLANKHMTPFESIEVWLEMKLPIFVARQFVRHRTFSYNEVSARYVQLPAEWYIPALEDVVIQSKDKKQGGRPIDLNNHEEVAIAKDFQGRLNMNCGVGYASYQRSIDAGIAMEQARLDLHLNHYTHWLCKASLRNVLHFLSLRNHGHAQGEAQQYARAVTQLLSEHLPGLMRLHLEVTNE